MTGELKLRKFLDRPLRVGDLAVLLDNPDYPAYLLINKIPNENEDSPYSKELWATVLKRSDSMPEGVKKGTVLVILPESVENLKPVVGFIKIKNHD